MRRALTDLALGARLAATGGFDSRLRTALTAVGVSFGVALLLFAASVPNMLAARDAREQARMPQSGPDPARTARLIVDPIGTTYHGSGVSIVALQRTGAHPALPPGVSQIPQPGTMLVSPALERLLRAPAGAELERRLHARISGTIADSGLTGPAELFAYRGASDLAARGGVAITSFGSHASDSGHNPLIALLVVLMTVALLLPVGVFVATASRFGSEQRNARLAALRLLGLDRAGTARVAAGEALFGALIGVVIGIAGFLLILRPLAPHTDIAGVSVFARDVRPSLGLAILALLLVPVAAVACALLAMRQVAIEPLGVARQGRPRQRRLAWRLATPVLGFLLLIGLVGASSRLASTGGQIEAAAGIVMVLIGVCALLPWLVEAAVVRSGGGSVAWLLAVRRLRLDHGTSGRVVGAIGLAVAGAIALQTVFSGAQSAGHSSTPAAARGLVEIDDLIVPARDPEALVMRRLRSLPGVRDVFVSGTGPQSMPVGVAPCATVTALTGASCGRGSSYLRSGFGAGEHPGRVATVWAMARVSATGTDAEDRLLDAVAQLDPLAQVSDVGAEVTPRDLAIDKLQRVLTAAAVAVLLVIAASLLISVAEQLRERRRVLAVMAAFGTRASTLALSVLWQTALPVVLGLALALLLGAGLGAALMDVVGLPISFDWGSIALLAGAGVGVVAVVTALTLPILLKQIDPEALRAE